MSDESDSSGWHYNDQEKVQEARNRIQAVLDELRETISPAQSSAAEEDGDEDSVYFPSDWCLVIGWVRADDGAGATSIIGSGQEHGPMQKGLLHIGLYELGV